ncbi:hypothetical protein BGZ68_003524, partial [Mortierella alpina]
MNNTSISTPPGIFNTAMNAAASSANAVSTAQQGIVVPAQPLVPGRWGIQYEARFAKRHNGAWTWRFHCRQHGCSHHYSPNSATGTLKRHFSTDHRAAYNEMQRAATQQATRQPTLFELPIPQRALDRLAIAALNWIIQSMQPFSALDSPAFREMIQAVNPQVRLPCSATIRAMLADHTLLLEDMLKVRFAETLEFGSLTTDSWTSAANRPYMSVTLHWLDKDFGLHECALALEPQPYPHTAQPTALLI